MGRMLKTYEPQVSNDIATPLFGGWILRGGRGAHCWGEDGVPLIFHQASLPLAMLLQHRVVFYTPLRRKLPSAFSLVLWRSLMLRARE